MMAFKLDSDRPTNRDNLSGEILSKRVSPNQSPHNPIAEEPREAIPDGGLTAWLQVLGCFFVYFSSWGMVNTFGTFETYYITVLPEAPSEIAWIGTIEGFLLVFIGVVIGAFHDRGFFRSLLAIGSFLLFLGVLSTSFCTEYWQLFLAQSLCIGLGSGLIFLPSLVVVATYFSKSRGFATGICVAGGQVGGVIFPIVFRQINSSIGFGWATRIIGFIILAVLLVANLVMKPRVPRTRKPLVDLSAFREPAYVAFCLGMLITFTGLYQPLYYTPTFGERILGMDIDSAFYLTAITNGSSIAGCILLSIISDRFGPLNLMIPSTILTATLGFLWISVDSVPKLQALVAFYGFFTGILISLPNPILVSLTPALDRVGTRVGMAYTFAAFGLLIGSPLGGLLINVRTGEFLHDQLWAGCFISGGAVCFIVAKLFDVRQGRPRGI